MGSIQEITAPKPGTLADLTLKENQRRMAAAVLREQLNGQLLENAYSIVAEDVACRLFPDLRDRLERWAERVLEEAEQRPEAHLELARKVDEASRQGEALPGVPEDLYAQIEPALSLMKPSTFLPQDYVQLIAKAGRRAYKAAQELLRTDPRWARIWSYLERRYSRPA